MAVRLYNPTGSVNRRRSPFRQQQQQRSQPEQRMAAPLNTYDYALTLDDRNKENAKIAKASQKKDDDGGGGWTAPLSKGLGVVLNNSVVKNLMQPLDILGVPQRAIASTIQEVKDIASGEGADFGDWWDQTNPFHFAHGQGDATFGMGDVIPDTGNKWADRFIGLGGDILTDPLTYVFGLGVVDKGLDGLRSGTRLGATLAEQGSDMAKAGKAVADGASQAFVNQAKKNASRTSSTSLTGRPVRGRRVSEAQDLLERADGARLDALYGIEGAKDRALAEIRRRGGRGLGSAGDEGVKDLVETALNIKGPRVSMKVPLVGKTSKAVPGSGRPAQSINDLFGEVKLRTNLTKPGQKAIGARTPIDAEKGMKILARGEKVDSELYSRAAQAVRLGEDARGPTGLFNAFGQREMSRATRRRLKQQQKKLDAQGRSYTRQAETPGVKTEINEMFENVVDFTKDEFGISLPLLGGGLDYLPHSLTPRASRAISPKARRNLTDEARYGQSEQNLTAESGRVMGRELKGGETIELADGGTFKVPQSGMIDDINEAALAHPQLGFKLLEDDVVKLYDDYVQIVAEDVGRRVSRAKTIATREGAIGEGGEGVEYLTYGAHKGITPDVLSELPLERAKAAELAGVPESNRAANFFPTVEPDDPEQLAALLEKGGADRIARIMGEEGNLPDLFRTELSKWAEVGSNKAILMDPEIDGMLRNVGRSINDDPSSWARAFRWMNRYFKTYAVLSPGFHVRNGLSAMFMNAADNVPAQTTVRGMNLWNEYSRAAKKKGGAQKWYDAQSPEIQQAFEAVGGSGAGGRFTEAGVAEGAAGKVSRALLENRATRLSQDAGAWVEGSVRMGMALDTIESGGSVAEAIQRITRVHFDYSQVSRFDEKAKQFFPFWSFLSRNIPLQVMQQWSRPGSYARFQHFQDNFADWEGTGLAEDEIPDYIAAGGGVPLDLPFGVGNWFEPDLPHTKLSEEVERWSNVLNNPAGATSGLSPLITSGLEYGTNTDFFTGQQFGEDDYTKINLTDVMGLVSIAPAALSGNLERGDDGSWWVHDKVLNAVQAIDPTLSRISRVTGQGGQEPARQWEAAARWLGAPIRNITDKQIAGAEMGRYFDEADEYRRWLAINSGG